MRRAPLALTGLRVERWWMASTFETNRHARTILTWAYKQKQPLGIGHNCFFNVDVSACAALGVSEQEAGVAIDRLRRAGAIKIVGGWATFDLTDHGMNLAEDETLLDAAFPVAVTEPVEVKSPSASTPETAGYLLNVDARRLLELLHARKMAGAGRGVTVVSFEDARDAGCVEPRAAFARLRERGLAIPHASFYRMTDEGTRVAEDPEELDELLPIGPRGSTAPLVAAASSPDRVGRLEFDFMADAALRAIVERDVGELRRADAHDLDKCIAILSGSIVEALLLDVLSRRPDRAQSMAKKPQNWPEKMSLGELVSIAVHLKLVEPTAEPLVLKLTDFRDLVHPQRERREKPKVDRDTSGALLALLRLVVRDLVEAHTDGRIIAYQTT